MTRLLRFPNTSPRKWIPQIIVLRSPCCTIGSFTTWAAPIPPKDRILFSKSPNFYGVSDSCSNGGPLRKWAPNVSSKNQILASNCYSSKAPHFRLQSVCARVEISLLGGVRGFCAEVADSDDARPPVRGPRVTYQAQDALMDYLHVTAGLEFYDAEHMSKNCPHFLDKILKKVEKEKEEVGRALSRFLRYHPPNEFELLFESMGLKPSEFKWLLPRDMIYLKDDELLLNNYHVLCNYGIDRSKIGRILKEATAVFRYEQDVLGRKLKAYEDLGLSKLTVIKIVASSPCLLIGDTGKEFVKVLEELGDVGIQRDWIEGLLSEKNLYCWGRMPMVLESCLTMGLSKKEVGMVIKKHPDLMLEGSGRTFLSLIGFLLKVGAASMELSSLIRQFPQVQVERFMKNLRHGLLFLLQIEMDPEDIKMLLRTHPEIFGQYSLKKANSVVSLLQTSSKKLSMIIKDDPHQLKRYVKGSKLCPLPNAREEEEEMSRVQKREFLLRLGFVENSDEMLRALRDLRGKGRELQDRYNFLVKCGLQHEDVCNMIKRAPNVLNQKIEVLERKVDVLTEDLGFPVTSLAEFPKFLAYNVDRVKLRLSMYNWLKDRGNASPWLALSSILACSDEIFIKRLVSRHPDGLKMWQKFKAEFIVN